MSNEMKLITALCEALGFEVKQTEDYQKRKEHGPFPSQLKQPFGNDRQMAVDHDNAYLRYDDGSYVSVLINPIVSYELAKDTPTEEIESER